MTNDRVSIWWVRLDLRLADNPALEAAVRSGSAVVPVFIWCPEEEAPWQPGGASKWWLHQSLAALEGQLRAVGSRLVVRHGAAWPALRRLVIETRATGVYWNRRYEPASRARDQAVKEALRAEGLRAESFNAALLNEPWQVENQSGRAFQVFTPYWRHCLGKPEVGEVAPAPRRIPAPKQWPKSLPLAELQLEPRLKWAEGFGAAWRPGEAGAAATLDRFLDDAFTTYSEQRNRPDLSGTSRLSPYLHFGEISPRQIWQAVRNRAEQRGLSEGEWRGSQFLAEVGWREFAHHLIFHFPHTAEEPLRGDFVTFPWRRSDDLLRAWQKGLTGFPIVDAGMRELWATGWMHNRVRMIAASFLVKDLLLPWQEGARWFWDTLVDADLAQNSAGWQWTAGCGADAAPYFRVFNPTTQGMKFDPDGEYVRRWCPELAKLPASWIHQPDKAPQAILSAARVELGRQYPHPIVNHAQARQMALEAFASLKKAHGSSASDKNPRGRPRLVPN